MSYPFNELYSIFQKSSDVQETLSDITAYDDPCFILIYFETINPQHINQFYWTGLPFKPDSSKLIYINNNLLFATIYMDDSEAEVFCDGFEQFVSSNYGNAKLSVFRLNPLSSPEQTLKMASMQLHELISDNSLSFAINDFTNEENWPGIAKYSELLEPEFESIPESNTNSNIDTDTKEPAFGMSPALEEIAPFISTLPNGDLLWSYVVTGEGKQQLEETNAFIDLDHVLIFKHAKLHAPSFYKTMFKAICHDSLPNQYDVSSHLHRILSDLTCELLETSDNKQQRQACYLRVVDVFYHLLDQALLCDQIHNLLVEDTQTACLPDEDYQQRYNLDYGIETNDDSLTPDQEKKLNSLSGNLERYFLVSDTVLLQINKLWSETSNVSNIDNWDLQDEPHERLLASIFLANNHKNSIQNQDQDIQDHNTQTLQNFIDQHLLNDILEMVSDEIEYEHKQILSEKLQTWLSAEDDDFDVLVEQMKSYLELDSDSPKRDANQPIYEILGNVKDFRIVLTTCYFYELSGGSVLTQRLIKLFLQLAPQATLSCFSKLYTKRNRFNDNELEKEFKQFLTTFKVSEQDQFSFFVRIHSEGDMTKYEALIKEYLACDTQKQAILDTGIQRLLPKNYQRFYADACLIQPTFDFPVADEYTEVFGEIYSNAQRLEDEIFLSHFSSDNILFADYLVDLPSKYELPKKINAHMPELRRDLRLFVARYKGDHLELLIGKIDDQREGFLNCNDLIIINDEITDEELFKVYAELPNREARKDTYLESFNQFLNGDISFSDYQKRTDYLVDTSKYKLNGGRHNDYIGIPLPIIQTQKDNDKKMRFIKVLTAHPSRGIRILNDICLELFLNELFINDQISLEDLRTIEHDDLNSEAEEALRQFHINIKKQLIALV